MPPAAGSALPKRYPRFCVVRLKASRIKLCTHSGCCVISTNDSGTMLATVGPSIPRGPVVGLNSADSGSDGTGDDLGFETPPGDLVEAVFVDSASFVSFSLVLSADSDSAAGVADFCDFFLGVEAGEAFDSEDEALGVVFGAGVRFEASVGVGFGVVVLGWKPPDFFFFGSTPEAIRTIPRNVVSSVKALRVME